MAQIDTFLTKMAEKGVQRALLISDAPGSLLINGHSIPGPTIQQVRLDASLREIAPPNIQAVFSDDGQLRYSYVYGNCVYDFAVERLGGTLRASITPVQATSAPAPLAASMGTSQVQTSLPSPQGSAPSLKDAGQDTDWAALATSRDRVVATVVSIAAVMGVLTIIILVGRVWLHLPWQHLAYMSIIALSGGVPSWNAALAWSVRYRESGDVYAGFWIRAAASLIDYLVLLLPLYVVSAIIDASEQSSDERDIQVVLLCAAVNWAYFAAMESSVWQATVGKRLCGLQVTDVDGARISFARATGRYVSKLLCWITFGLGYIAVAFTEKRQGLHDLVARTVVMKRSS